MRVQSNTATTQQTTHETTLSKSRAEGVWGRTGRTENADPDKVEQRRHLEHPTEESRGGIRSRLVVYSMSPGRAVRPATRVPGTSVMVVRKVGRVVGMRGRGRFASSKGGPQAT